jgi:CRISPR-associated protein Cas2
MADEHLYIVTYDIGDDKRWRRVFRILNGQGEWLQLSVFQCRLTRARALELQARLTDAISAADDHVMLIDVGPADGVKPRVQSIGKRAYAPVERAPVIV